MRWALLGLSLGLGAGVSPGPLLALVLSTSLREGTLAGLATACAPLVSDAAVVLVSALTASLLPRPALAAAAVVGGGFVVWLGVSAWREAAQFAGAAAKPLPQAARTALSRAVVVNLASPHPWIFWLTVGGPLLVTAWQHSAVAGVGFLFCFYLLLVGAKAVIAIVLGRTRHRLPPRALRMMLQAAAALLVVAGVALAAEFAPQLWG
ncbi:MAG: LysE family transporter [Actinomycetales bacterium]